MASLSETIAGLLGLGGGGLLTMEAIDKIGGVGDKAQSQATALAKELRPESQFKPFTVTSGTGSRFGATMGPDGPEVSLNMSPQESAMQNRLFSQSGNFFNDASQPTAEREMDIYNRIRAAQSPEEQRQMLAMEERMMSQGRLGMGTAMYGGSPEQFAFGKAQAEARNQSMLLAMQQAQQEQTQMADLGQQYLAGSYIPQAQLMNVQSGSQLYPQMEQQQRLFGIGEYGETMLSGIEAKLLAEQAKANLYGTVGSGLLNGVFAPVSNGSGGTTNMIAQLLSDARLKTNIRKVDEVDGINLYTWDWTEEGKKKSNNTMTFGVLAQEVQQVLPSAVVENADGYLMVDYSKLPEVAKRVGV